MKFPNSAAWLLMVGLIAWSPRLLAQSDTSAEAWGDSINGLQVSLYLDPQQTGTNPQLRIGLRNVGSSNIFVTLGGHCGPGGIETAAINLDLTDSQGQSQRLTYWKVVTGYCAGNATLYVVPLMPGASFSTPLDLNEYKYWSGATNTLEQGWKPGGTYFFLAELQGVLMGNRFLNRSNRLQVHFPSK